MEATSLITKYRPIAFDEVLGNTVAVKALRDAVLSSSRHHAYLFTGPSGTGKTTLARIIAAHIDATIEEIDAASNSGVEDARRLVEASQYQPILSTKNKLIIIDECHAMSKAAFQVLLKLIEEPPAYLYFALATTEVTKVPETIRTRCQHVMLKALKHDEMCEYVEMISQFEKWALAPGIADAIAVASTGSPRKALSILQQAHGVVNKSELAQVVAEVEKESAPVIELCRNFLLSGKPVKSWDQDAFYKILAQVEYDDDPCAIVAAYCSAASIRTGAFERSAAIWRIIDAFTFPRATFDKRTQFMAALGAFMFGGQ